MNQADSGDKDDDYEDEDGEMAILSKTKMILTRFLLTKRMEKAASSKLYRLNTVLAVTKTPLPFH